MCPVCDDRNDPSGNDKKNRMIGCDGCDKWYHWSCVGINQSNKPGKNDDWFCKKCPSKKTEAGEWKPEGADTDNPDNSEKPKSEVKTLAQRKSYDSQVTGPSKVTKSSKNSTHASVQNARESWSTKRFSNGPRKQPASAISSSTEWTSEKDSESEDISNTNNFLQRAPNVPSPRTQVAPKVNLPHGVSLFSSSSERESESEDSSKIHSGPKRPPNPPTAKNKPPPKVNLPPGVSLFTSSSDKESESEESSNVQNGSKSGSRNGNTSNNMDRLSRLSGITLSQPRSVDSSPSNKSTSSTSSVPPRVAPNLSKLPPGISLHKDSSSVSDEEDIAFIKDVGLDRSQEDEDENSSAMLTPKIKLIRNSVSDEAKTPPPPPPPLEPIKEAERERSSRDKREQTARIRATLSEDSISDDEIFGNNKVPFRKKNGASNKVDKKEPSDISSGDKVQGLKRKAEDDDSSSSSSSKKRGRPKKSLNNVEIQKALSEANGLRNRKSSLNKSQSEADTDSSADNNLEVLILT